MSNQTPSSGPISFQDLRAAIEDASGNLLSIDSTDVRSLAGTDYIDRGYGSLISMNDFRGKGGTFLHSVTGHRATWLSGGYRYYSFITSGELSCSGGYTQMQIFVLGGGGGGGAGRHGGGGGAGAMQVGSFGIGQGTRQIMIGAQGLEQPNWFGYSASDPSSDGTRGGDSGVTYSEAFAYGGGTRKSPTPGGCGAGGGSASTPAGTGIGASGIVTTGGYPGGKGDNTFPGPENGFVSGGGGGVAAKGQDALSTGSKPTSYCGLGGSGTSVGTFLPGWVFPSPSWPRRNAFGGGGSGSSGTDGPSGPSPITSPNNGWGGGAGNATGGNATLYSGGGGGGGRFSGNDNNQGGNGASGFICIRFPG